MSAAALEYLPPEAADRARAARAAGRTTYRLQRRGVDHGFVLLPETDPEPSPEPAATWAAARPVFLPGVLRETLAAREEEVRASLQTFSRLRRGGRFLDEVEQRLWDHPSFRYAGSTVDLEEPREIERIFVDAEREGREPVEDLTARLSWIADDESDPSLRIRFSHGIEQLGEWLHGDPEKARWSDLLAATVFPECAAIEECRPLQELLARLLSGPFRMSERIVYGNAPGGGAVFHHDADPGQRGVVFGQLWGRTAWLALPVRELAEAVAELGGGTAEAALRRLQGGPEQELWELLNRRAETTAHLARRGALFVLSQGDALLLPSHDSERVCWHSVFALGGKPSLAHSYGLFPAAP